MYAGACFAGQTLDYAAQSDFEQYFSSWLGCL